MEKNEIIKKIVTTSHYLYDKGLVPGKSGNNILKFKKDKFEMVAVTPSGLSLKSLIEKEIVIVDMEGNLVYDTNMKPTSELLMHLNIYKKRNDINSIVHTHSPIATGFAFAEEKLKRLEGFGPIEEKYIPFVDYYQPGSTELADAVSKELKKQDIVVLKKHGVVALGKNLDEATLLSEFIEESAKIQFIKTTLMANRL